MNRINISDLSGQIDGSGEFLTVQIRLNFEVNFRKQLNSSQNSIKTTTELGESYKLMIE